MAQQSAEELVKGIRGAGRHLPTKTGEAARKRREKKAQEAKNHKQGYEVLD